MENLRAEIAAIVSEVAEVPVNSIADDTLLAELGLDSLDALRLLAAIEKKYQVEVAEEDFGRVQTVGDIASLLGVLV